MKTSYMTLLNLFSRTSNIILGQKDFTKKFLNFLSLLSSRSLKSEMRPGLNEMVDVSKTFSVLVKINVATDDVTMNTRLNANTTVRFDEKSIFLFY